MVVGTETVGTLADVIFAIEGTAINGVYLNDIRTNYLIPTLEYFSQGCLTEERDYACDESSSALYGIVVYHAADRLPSPCTDIYGPYSNPQKLMQMLDKLELVGGRGESHANVAEALATSLVCFDDMQLRRDANANPQKHCILICNSPPYLMPVAENQTYAGKTAEQLAALFNEKSVNLTILSARKIPAMFKLYEKAGGDLTSVQSKNYAKDPRHLVLLKGFSLKERPVSPVHPMGPVPAPTAVGTGAGAGPRYPVYPQAAPQPRPPAPQRWPMPAPRPPPTFPQAPTPASSALIEQLTRPPSAIGPQFANNNMTLAQQQAQMRMMAGSNPGMPGTMTSQGNLVNVPPNMATTGPMVPGGVMGPGAQTIMGGGMMTAAQQNAGSMMVQNPNQQMIVQMQQQGVLGSPASMLQQNAPNTMMPAQTSQPLQNQAPRDSITIWQGVIEWLDKAKNGDGPKITRQVPCQVSAQPKDGEPELKADGWPNKLIMQLMPRSLISTIGGAYVKNSKSVVFHLQPCENLEVLTKVMSSGFAGCVHFNPVLREVKVLLLLYTPDRQAYLGFIPNDQTAFVDRLRKIIQQQQQKVTGNRALVGAAGALGGPGTMMGGGMQPGAGGLQGGMQPGPNRMQPGMSPGPAGMQPGMSPGTGGLQPGMQAGGSIQPGMAAGNSGMQGGLQSASGLQGGMPTSAAGMQPGMQSAAAGMQSGLQAGAAGMQGGMQPGMQGGLQPNAGAMQPGMQGSQQDQNGQNNQFTEAARQENLKQIQRLQMALEASQQQELQYKQLEFRNQVKIQQFQDPSQMPQQVLFEEQNKLRAQLQQIQGGQQRMIRPSMPNNPGLKLLLQQGHYRMQVGQQMRPGMQPQQQAQQPQQQQQQQFDDVSYDFLS